MWKSTEFPVNWPDQYHELPPTHLVITHPVPRLSNVGREKFHLTNWQACLHLHFFVFLPVLTSMVNPNSTPSQVPYFFKSQRSMWVILLWRMVNCHKLSTWHLTCVFCSEHVSNGASVIHVGWGSRSLLAACPCITIVSRPTPPLTPQVLYPPHHCPLLFPSPFRHKGNMLTRKRV